jgi:hypothetical protein
MALWGGAAKTPLIYPVAWKVSSGANRFVDRQPWLQAVPVDEVADCVMVGAPGVGRREAVQSRLGLLQVRQLGDRFSGSLLRSLRHLAGFHAAAKRTASRSNI